MYTHIVYSNIHKYSIGELSDFKMISMLINKEFYEAYLFWEHVPE